MATGLHPMPSAAASWLARPVTGAAKDASEKRWSPGYRDSRVKSALGDEPDVFGDIGPGGAGPPAISDFVVVAGIADVGRVHGPRKVALRDLVFDL